MSTTKTISIFALAFFIFTLFVHGHGYSDFLMLFSTATALIFGIFIVFSISNSRERLNKVNELLKIEDANITVLYKLTAIFGQPTQLKTRELLDDYMISQIDYRLEDYHHSQESFTRLCTHIRELEPVGVKQEIAYDKLLDTLASSELNRVMVETYISQSLTKAEWAAVAALTALIIYHCFEMTTGDLFTQVLITMLASASLLLVLVLRDLDRLKWEKGKWTWVPLHRVFLSIGLLPYYPKPILDEKEATPAPGQKIRVADYPHPYPDMTGKKVETIEI